MDGLQGQEWPDVAGLLGLGFAQDNDSSTESSGGPKIGDVREFWPFKILLTKARQSDVTEFHGKLDIPNDFEIFFIFAQ